MILPYKEEYAINARIDKQLNDRLLKYMGATDSSRTAVIREALTELFKVWDRYTQYDIDRSS